MDLCETSEEQGGRVGPPCKLVDISGFEKVNVHIHPDQFPDLWIPTGLKPNLPADCSVIRKVLPPFMINGSASRLSAVVKEVILSEEIIAREAVPEQGI